MVQRLGKTKIRVVPRDGEIEVTLNINITLDGQVTAMTANSPEAAVTILSDEDESVPTFIPDFVSGKKLDFGKKE